MRVAANGKALVEDRKRGHGLDRRFTAMLRVARLRVCFEVPARGEACRKAVVCFRGLETSQQLSSSAAVQQVRCQGHNNLTCASACDL